MIGNSCPILLPLEKKSMLKIVDDDEGKYKIPVHNGFVKMKTALGIIPSAVLSNLRIYFQLFLSTAEGHKYRKEFDEAKDDEERNKLVERYLRYVVLAHFKCIDQSKLSEDKKDYSINNEVAVPEEICKELNDAVDNVKNFFFPSGSDGILTISLYGDFIATLNRAAAEGGKVGVIMLRDMILIINCGGIYRVIFRRAVPKNTVINEKWYKKILGKDPKDLSKEEREKYSEMAECCSAFDDFNQKMNESVRFDWTNHEYFVVTGRDENGNVIEEKITLTASSLAKLKAKMSFSDSSTKTYDQYKFGNAFDNLARDIFMHLNSFLDYGDDGENRSLLKDLKKDLFKVVEEEGRKVLKLNDENDSEAYVKLLLLILDKIKSVIKKKKGEQHEYLEKIVELRENYEKEGLTDELRKLAGENFLNYSRNNAPGDWVNVFAYPGEIVDGKYPEGKEIYDKKNSVFELLTLTTAKTLLEMYIGIKLKMFDITGDHNCVFFSGTVDELGNVSDLPPYSGIAYDNPHDIRGRYMGGILDMIVVDSMGTPHIFDFKTSLLKPRIIDGKGKNLLYKKVKRKVKDENNNEITLDEYVLDDSKEAKKHNDAILNKIEFDYANGQNADKSSGDGLEHQYTLQLTYYYNILGSYPLIFKFMQKDVKDKNNNITHYGTTLNIIKSYVNRNAVEIEEGKLDSLDREGRLVVNSVYTHFAVPYVTETGEIAYKNQEYLMLYDATRYSVASAEWDPLALNETVGGYWQKQAGTFYGFESNLYSGQRFVPRDQSSSKNVLLGRPKSENPEDQEASRKYYLRKREENARRFIGDLSAVANSIREMSNQIKTQRTTEFSVAKDNLRKLHITDEFSVAMGNVIAARFSKNVDLVENFIKAIASIDRKYIDELFDELGDSLNLGTKEGRDALKEYINSFSIENENDDNETKEYKKERKAAFSKLRIYLSNKVADPLIELGKIFTNAEETEKLFKDIRKRDQLLLGGPFSSRYFGDFVRRNIFNKIKSDLHKDFGDMLTDIAKRCSEQLDFIDENFGVKEFDEDDVKSITSQVNKQFAELNSGRGTESDPQPSMIQTFINMFGDPSTDKNSSNGCEWEYFKFLSLRTIAANEGISIKRSSQKISLVNDSPTYAYSTASDENDEEAGYVEDEEDEEEDFSDNEAAAIEAVVSAWGTGNDEKNFRDSISKTVKKVLSRIPSSVTAAEADRNPFMFFIKREKTYDPSKLTDILIRHLCHCGDLPSMIKKIGEMKEARALPGVAADRLISMLSKDSKEYDESFASQFYTAFSKYQNIFTSIETRLNEETGQVTTYLRVINASIGTRDLYYSVSQNSTNVLRLLRAYLKLDKADIEALDANGDMSDYLNKKGSDPAAIMDLIKSAWEFYNEYTTPDEDNVTKLEKLEGDSTISESLKRSTKNTVIWIGDQFKKISDLFADSGFKEFLDTYTEGTDNSDKIAKVVESLGKNDSFRVAFNSALEVFLMHKNAAIAGKLVTNGRLNRNRLLKIKNTNRSISYVQEIAKIISNGFINEDMSYYDKDLTKRSAFVNRVIEMMKSNDVYGILRRMGISIPRPTYDRVIEESRLEDNFLSSSACVIFTNINNIFNIMNYMTSAEFESIDNYVEPDIFRKGAILPENIANNIRVLAGAYYYICDALSNSFDQVVQSGAYIDGKMRYTYINRSYITQFIHKLNGDDPVETREDFIVRQFLKPSFLPLKSISDYEEKIKGGKTKKEALKEIAVDMYNPILRDLLMNDELEIKHSQCVSYNGADYKSMTSLQYAAALLGNYFGINDMVKIGDDSVPMRNYRVAIFSNKPSLELFKFKSYSVKDVEGDSYKVLLQETARIKIALSRIKDNVKRVGEEFKFLKNEVDNYDVDWKSLYESNKGFFGRIYSLYAEGVNYYLNDGVFDEKLALEDLKKIISLPSVGNSRSATAYNALEFLNDAIKECTSLDIVETTKYSPDEEIKKNNERVVIRYIISELTCDTTLISGTLESTATYISILFRNYMDEQYKKQLIKYRDGGLLNPQITNVPSKNMVTISFPCLGGFVRPLYVMYDVVGGNYVAAAGHENEFNFVTELLGVNTPDGLITEKSDFNKNIRLYDIIHSEYSNRVKSAVRKRIFNRLFDDSINDSNDNDNRAKSIYHDRDTDTVAVNGLGFSKLKEYFYSDWLMTYSMINLTTGDLSFYTNHIEFQKRQAQMHSSSSKLNKYATWNGERVSDGKIRYVLIEDFNGDEFSSKVVNVIEKFFKEEKKKLKEKLKEKYGVTDRDIEEIADIREKINNDLDSYQAGVDTIIHKFKHKIDLTDGQSYTSPTGYRKKMVCAGKWSDEFEQAYKLATSIDRNKNKDIQDYFNELEGLRVLCQPIKPFCYGLLYGSDINVPFQVKNSEYMLFVAGIIADKADKRGNILKILNDLMERSHFRNGKYNKDGIDTIAFKSCVKVGASNVINVMPREDELDDTNKTVKRLEELIYNDKEKSGYTQVVKEVDMDDYGIQQEVPAHYANHLQQMASQGRILCEADVPSEIHRFVKGKWVTIKTGNDEGKVGVIDKYEMLIARKIKNSIDSFRKEFKMKDLFSKDVGKRSAALVEFKKKISKVLKDTVGTNEKYTSDLIDAITLDSDNNFCRNLNDEAISSRVQELLNSYIKKRINKSEMPGGPIVQVSGCGVSQQLHIRWRGKDGSIMLTEEEFESLLAKKEKVVIGPYTDSEGNEVGKTEYTDYKKYQEEFSESVAYLEAYAPVPSEEIAKLLTYNGRLLSPDEAVKKCLITRDMVDKISRIIGVRIPTEDKYSMLPIKIVGWLSSYYSGEGIILPDEITTLTGSDFDIDKLFVTHFNFSFGELDVERYIRSLIKDGVNIGLVENGRKNILNDMYSNFVSHHRSTSSKVEEHLFLRFFAIKNIESVEYPTTENEWSEIKRKWNKHKEEEESYSKEEDDYEDEGLYLACLLENTFGEKVFNYNFEDLMKFILLYNVGVGVTLNTPTNFLNRLSKLKGRERVELISSMDASRLQKEMEKLEKEMSAKDREMKFSVGEYSYTWLAVNYGHFFFNNIKINDNNLDILEKEQTEDEFEKEIKSLSQAELDNYILECQWSFLTDRSVVSKMFNPGSFDPQDKIAKVVTIKRNCDRQLVLDFLKERNLEVKDAKDDMALYDNLMKLSLDDLGSLLDSAEEDNHNILFVGSQIYFFEQNMAAAKLIGTIANNSIAHAILQRQDIRYVSPTGFNISIGGYSTVSNNENKERDIVSKGTKLDDERDCKDLYISKNIAGFEAASLDAAKKPVLNYLNINGITISPLMCLIRLGFDVNSASLFISQDVIVEVVRRFSQENANGHINVSTVITRYIEELCDKCKSLKYDENNLIKEVKKAPDLSIKDLFGNIGVKYDDLNTDQAEKKAQLDIKILIIFQKLMAIASDVRDMTEQCRYNSMMYAVGPRVNDTISRRKSVNDFNQRYVDTRNRVEGQYEKVNFLINYGKADWRIISNSKILSAFYYDIYGFNPLVEPDESSSVRLTKGIEREIMESLGFIEYGRVYNKVIDRLQAISKYGLDDSELKKIKGEFIYYLLTKGSIVSEDGKSVEITPGFYLSTSEVRELLENYPKMWKTTVSEARLGKYGETSSDKSDIKYAVETIDKFFTIEEKNEFHPEYDCLDLVSSSLKPESVEEFKNAINILCNTPGGFNIARNLFRYSMLRSGGHFAPRSAYHLFTTEFIQKLPSYNYALANLDKIATDDDVEVFCDQYVRNHNGKRDYRIIKSIWLRQKNAKSTITNISVDYKNDDLTIEIKDNDAAFGNGMKKGKKILPNMLPISTNSPLYYDAEDLEILYGELGEDQRRACEEMHKWTSPYVSKDGVLYKLLKVEQLGIDTMRAYYKRLKSLGKPGMFVEYDSNNKGLFLKSAYYQGAKGITMNFSSSLAYTIWDPKMEKEYDSILSHERRFVLETETEVNGEIQKSERDVTAHFYWMIQHLVGIVLPQEIINLANQFELDIRQTSENEEYRRSVLESLDALELDALENLNESFMYNVFGEEYDDFLNIAQLAADLEEKTNACD